MEEKKKNTSLYIIIAILLVLTLCLSGYIIYDKIIKDKNTEPTQEQNYLTGKINLNDYCTNNENCKKELGNINIDNQSLKLSIDFEYSDKKNIKGNITLGNKTLNLLDLSYFDSKNSFDGFEIYQNYLILYASSLDTLKNDNSKCELKDYTMYIFDYNLKEISSLKGYTQNNAFTDFKIENDYLYFYSLNGFTGILDYNKINFEDLLKKNYDNNEYISSIKECKVDIGLETTTNEMVGTWSDNNSNEFTITNIENNTITFSWLIYRLALIDNVTLPLENDKAIFYYHDENNDEPYCRKATIELKENSISIKVENSTLEEVNKNPSLDKTDLISGGEYIQLGQYNFSTKNE